MTTARQFTTRYEKTCATCGTGFVARSKTAMYCGSRCKGWAHRRPGVTPTALRDSQRGCEQCGASMEGRHGNARFCDNKCWHRFHNPAPDLTAPLTCDTCGSSFLRKNERGLKPKFCSTRCEQWRRRNPDATWNPDRTCDYCGINIAHKKSNARYCSELHGSFIKGAERRARIRELPHEPISKIKVFERDGWRCHLCHKRINKRLQHPHPKSASLDHIIPLSDPESPGHIWANVAASHLACNLSKNCRSQGDQLLLFGAA